MPALFDPLVEVVLPRVEFERLDMVESFVGLSHSFVLTFHERFLNLTEATPENKIHYECQYEHCNSCKETITHIVKEEVERQCEHKGNLCDRTHLLA
jgi:hypothetical protein